VKQLHDGVLAAEAAIDSGKAKAVLDQLRAAEKP
jgi:anthranilate phosphoribosyltransferase